MADDGTAVDGRQQEQREAEEREAWTKIPSYTIRQAFLMSYTCQQ